MSALIIRHVEASDPPQFQVIRPEPFKATTPVAIVSPASTPVKDLPNSNLSAELRWYLEDFLDYPFPPVTDRAEHVQDALRGWGEQAFTALFGAGSGRDFYHDAYREGLENLDLRIASDHPGVLAWPWEALADPQQAGALAHHCRIERQLDRGHDPLELPKDLPRDCINILFVTARPYEGDVRFRSLSRPVVEWIEQRELPARVTILRPPTFERLREHLRERPAYYHIVHFDGHGGYGMAADADGNAAPHRFKGPQGRLIFETEHGQPDAVPAAKLGALLREHRIPVMVLNACRSAMVSDGAGDAFASVAASLLRAGIRSVVAMAYSLYVSGAEEFLPAFYRRVFESGNLAEGMRAGRQAMLAKDGRVCARGRFPLEDWLVPVVYQQDPPDLSFGAGNRAVIEKPELPPEARDSENPYGFVGRDSALLQLERALRRPPAGILIHGLAGVGKTTLARGLMQWLRDTDGLGEGCFWFTFNDIRSSEYVFNQLVAALFGTDVMAADMAQKQAMLVDVFKKHRFILVWDNFESATGVPGTALTAGLPEPDRQRLRGFLGKLRGGASKVIITSRSPEAWLGADRCFALSLGGLQGEERWEYCATILRDLGLDADQKDAGLKNLMDVLGGHPLAMRALLPRLSEVGASVLAEQLKGRIQVEPGSDSLQARLFAALEFVEEALPTALQPLLLPLGLHERFVDANLLEFMAQRADSRFSRADIERLLAMLAVSGLLCPLGRVIHEMHPALTGFLRARPVVGLDDNQREAWRRAFVGVMGRLADHLAPKELHEQRCPFHCHGVNFHTALAEAEALGMDDHFAALTQALGVYARERWDFASAKQRFAVLAEHFKQHSNVEGEAVAYHQLGIIAEERWDFAAAEQWYWKALAIVEKQGDEHRAAITYHQLGMIAKKRRDFAAAEQWYRKSLAIEEKYGNEHGAAITYHALGNLAEDRREFAAAERWYQKALAITEKHGNEHGAAITYHQLGRIAQERQEFTTAEQWYRKALAIWEKQGDEHRAADTYGQLGILAQERREFVMAEHWYRKVLAIVEKQGDEYRAAITYHKLGMIAQERWEFAASAQWYRKSLTIKEKQGDEHGAASTYGELGILAGLQNHFLESGHWLIRCIMAFANQHDSQGAERNAHNFLIFYRQAPLDDQAQLRQIWEEAKLGTFPEDGNPP